MLVMLIIPIDFPFVHQRFVVFMAVKIQAEVFWVVTPCTVVVDRGSEVLQTLVSYNTTQHQNPEDLDLNPFCTVYQLLHNFVLWRRRRRRRRKKKKKKTYQANLQ
jgi:glucan phosphoethanolaminetransferase (alkaline phosphatase superfamily)